MKIGFVCTSALASVLLAALFVFWLPQTAFAASCTSAGSGNWTAITWTGCPSGPASGDDVTIRNGDSVTVNVDVTVNSLTFVAGTSGTTLTISGSNALTVTTNFTFTAPTSGNTFLLDVGAGSLSVGGTLTFNSSGSTRVEQLSIGTGTATVNTLAFSGTGSANRIVFNGAGRLSTAGGFPSGATLTHYATSPGSTVEFTGGTAQSISSYTFQNVRINKTAGINNQTTLAITVTGNLTIDSGGLLDSGNQITGNVTGTLTVASGALLRIGSNASATSFPTNFTAAHISLDTNSTVVYNAGPAAGLAQTVSAIPTYGNLQIGVGATSNYTKTLGGATTVIGNLTIITGTLATNNNNLTIGGNWTNNGTFDEGTGGTTTFNRNGTSTLSLLATGGTETFCNLTVITGTLLDTTDDFVAVSGSGSGCSTTPTVYGKLRREAQVSVTDPGPYYFNDSWNLNSVVLTGTTTISHTLGGSTTMTVTSNITPTTWTCGSKTLGGQSVLRLYDIHPSNSGPYNQYTLRLYFRASNPNESNGNTTGDPYNLAIYHCDGTTWTRLPGTGGNDIINGVYVEVTGVDSFSPFAIGGGPGATTAVTFSNMSAQPSSDPFIPILTGIGVLLLLSSGGLLTWKRFKAT